MAHGRRRARRAASGHARHAMPSIPRYETRTAQGSPGPAAAVGPRRRPGTRLRGDQRAARAQRPGVHPAGGNRLPSPAPARGGGPAAQLLGRAGRQAPAALRAHRQGRGGPAGTPRRVAPLLDRHPGRGRGTGVTADLIERYLDRLLTQLRGSAHDVRRILSETEDHLRDAASELMAAGASEEEAQRQAIARFGDARAVARRFSTRLAPIPPVAVAAELARAAVLLGAVGLVAIGASGALAELLGRACGARFVAGDLPDVTYTPQRCAEFLEYFPNAGSCAQAAALHHWGEVVEYRVAAGALWRRGRRRRQAQYLGVLPDGFSATVATSLYGVAAAILGLQSLESFVVARGAGNGQWLSGAIVALAMAVAYGTSLYRTVLARAPLRSSGSSSDPAERS